MYNPFWLGTPHTATSDFTYQGKFIPKDTVMILNTWTMHHDERRFSNPEVFDVTIPPSSINLPLVLGKRRVCTNGMISLRDISTILSLLHKVPISRTLIREIIGCSALGKSSLSLFLHVPPSPSSFFHTDQKLTPHHSRRICPGMIVAEREIWLTISRMLWAYDMSEVPGQPIDLREYDGMSGRSPTPFVINITPRSGEVVRILEGLSDC